MNCNEMVLEYINEFDEDEPIFIDDVKTHIKEKIGSCDENVLANVNVILNRLTKSNVIEPFYKGIYYKPSVTELGKMGLDINKVIKRKYLVGNDGSIKGYVTGAKLFNILGLTTQVPKVIDIVTNECKTNNTYYNEKLRTNIRKPKIEINNENYRYLQLIDIIENRDKVNIEVDYDNRIIYEFIKKNELDFEKIIKYARETNSKKVLGKLLILAK